MNASLFWRIVIALVCALAIMALLVPVSRLLGFSVSGDMLTVVRICVAVVAVLYIVTGKPS